MKAFVTGPTGFLGTNLVQELARAGWEIVAFHRESSDTSELDKLPGIRHAIGDVRDKASVERAMPEGLDAVFHAAAAVGFFEPGYDREQYEINELGTRNVVEVALARRPRRLIATSTILTYDYHGRVVDETSPQNTDPTFAYIHSKYLAELEIEKAVGNGLDAVVLHPAAVFGAYDKATWSKMFREISRGLHVPFAPPGAASLAHMRKVAQTHLAAVERGRAGGHYILGGTDATFMEIASRIAAILGRRGPLGVVPAPLFRVLGRIEFRVSTLLRKEPMLTPSLADMLCETVFCDSTKAVRELGYEPSSLDTMLMDCYEWMVGAGMLPAKARG